MVKIEKMKGKVGEERKGQWIRGQMARREDKRKDRWMSGEKGERKKDQ